MTSVVVEVERFKNKDNIGGVLEEQLTILELFGNNQEQCDTVYSSVFYNLQLVLSMFYGSKEAFKEADTSPIMSNTILIQYNIPN